MSENAALGVNVRVAPFDMLDILALDISAAPNEHATATVRGTIDEDAESGYLSLARSGTTVTVSLLGDDGSPLILFAGMISEMELSESNGLKVLDLRLIAGTGAMDAAEHTRTYQNASLTYRDLLSSLGYYPDYSFSMRIGEGAAIGDLITQFKETDWEFVKRLASHFNGCVVPDYVSGGVGYYFGLPYRSSGAVVDASHYKAVKGVAEYMDKAGAGVGGLSEGDALCFAVRDRAVYRVGEEVRFMNRPMRVFSVRSVLEGQLLQNYYILKSEAGAGIKKAWNFKLVGASLAGVVTAVRKDMIQMRVYEDNDNYGTGAKWFHYSTVYSSPDGTGWYAMPEPGDELRLYFPSEKESEAYAISAVNVDTPGMGEGNAPPSPGILPLVSPRTEPNVKTMINKDLKEVSLYPDKIVMTNNKDMMIVVDDAEGIIIQSAKKVTFKSDESISLDSAEAELSMIGSDKVSVTVGGTKVTFDADAQFEGSTVHMQ
ncbi:MAG: phage late control D family protein [Oscillospiraceae bacterium]|jgi:hypothetical protein|nr:phage late control D family protein [Oscillospiraceae bacterium]